METHQNIENLSDFLMGILESNSGSPALDWLKVQAGQVQSSGSEAKFFLAFSRASRYFKRVPLTIGAVQNMEASGLVEGLDLTHWDVLQTARTFLLLQYPLQKSGWFHAFNQLFETADMYEHQALFASLPVMPYPEDMIPRAIDGLRTNVSLIFDAIALNNPYPAVYFPEPNWNQMVLKAIFMQRPLYQIQRLDDRNNAALANIASDYAHERWAAGRKVMPELWQLTVPFMNEEFLRDIRRVLDSPDPLEVKAGVLTCYESEFPAAKALALGFPDIVEEIEKGEISWLIIGQEFELSKN